MVSTVYIVHEYLALLPGPMYKGEEIEGLVHTACAYAGYPRKMWGTGYHCIPAYTLSLSLLCWHKVGVLNNAHPNDRIRAHNIIHVHVLAPFMPRSSMAPMTWLPERPYMS